MAAIKPLLTRLLNAYLSPYIENLNSDDFSVPYLGGVIEFHGLHLKKSLLERFGLPVEIVAGDIGHLSITISFANLKNEPVRIALEDVYILARARAPGKVDPEEDARIEQASKQDRLKSAEAVDSAASQVAVADDGTGSKQSYFGAIISKIVGNVQISIKGIHIRYEDRTSTPEHPFAAGITLDELKAVSTDENWMEAFIANSIHGVHKLAKLSALSIYFDTDTSSLDRGTGDRQGTIDALRHMLAGSPKHQYILKPVTGEARAILNKSMSAESPHIDAQVIFDEIGVVFDRDQYRDVLSVVDVFHFYRRTHQYHKFRPPEVEYTQNAARARLKFALTAIKTEIHEKHRRWSWEYMAQRRDTRKKYVEIYVKKLALPEGKELPAAESSELAEMEHDLDYEDIRFFRSVARVQAKKDAATRRKMEAERKAAQAARQTWGEWLWGTGKSETDENGMSEEEKKEIDDIIDYDPNAVISMDAHKDYMRARVSATLNKGSFTLRADPHGKNSSIIALVFDSFSADAVQYAESVTGKLALGGFRVYDGTLDGSLYPQIVRVKDIETKSGGNSRQTSLDVGGTDTALAEISKGLDGDKEKDPFFVVEFEHNPLDGRADNAVTVKMRHLEIIYHRGYVEAVMAFLKPPESQLESISALLDAAGQTLDGIRKETRAGLEYALDQHKTVDLRVDMNAPIIIIPMDVRSKDSQALVLDAGHIAVESKMANQEQLKEVQSKRGKQYSQDDYRQLEDLMYDNYSFRLEATQLLMGPDVETCLKALDDPHSSETDMHIIERINMSFLAQNSIVNAPTLTKFKVAGDLPELQLNFSDRKYKTLMKFIDVAVPHFGDDEPAEAAAAIPLPTNRRQSYRPPPLEDYVLDDTRSIMSAHTGEVRDDGSSQGDKDEKFYEAEDDTLKAQETSIQQVTFQFTFTVGKLQTSLFKSISNTVERPLADAVLEGFGLTFQLRKFDMSVDLFLQNVTLAMTQAMTASQHIRRPLLSSADVDGSSEDHKLVRVRYRRVQKNSPEYMTKYEGVDQSVDTELSTFKITVAPEPILALYDFIMTTFVPKDEQPAATIEEIGETPEDKADQVAAPPQSSDKIRVRVKLTSAQVSLENNDSRFALLTLPSFDVAIMLRSGTMRIGARLGDISLQDLSEGEVADPAFKQLLTIDGNELADFSYETYDPTDTEVFPGYNASLQLRLGSLRFTYMEQPIRDLHTFATKFARMKAVYDAAQQAAVQRASEVSRLHYDVEIKTPIFILPGDGLSSKDKLVARIGEIVVKNEFLGDPSDTSTIDASLKGTSLLSEICVDDACHELQMVDQVAITAKVKQIGEAAHSQGTTTADTSVDAEMSDVKLSLTQRQYVLLMAVLNSLSSALATDEEGEELSESYVNTPADTSTLNSPTREESEESGGLVSMEPELVVSPKANGRVAVRTSLLAMFHINSIALELYSADAMSTADLKKNSIARFALNEAALSYKQLSTGDKEAAFSLRTISFVNTRSGSSAHRDIIPKAKHGGKQIELQFSQGGGTNPSSALIASIDSPQLILSIEPLAALLEFAISPWKKTGEEPEPAPQPDPDAGQEFEEGPTPQKGTMSILLKVVEPTIIVLANDADAKSQAIHLQVALIEVSSDHTLSANVKSLQMAFGRMDQPEDRVSFLDSLDIRGSRDTRRRGSQLTSDFDLDIPVPVIFRASYNDIQLILDIVSKASAAASKAFNPAPPVEASAADATSTIAGDRRLSVADGRRLSISDYRRQSIVDGRTDATSSVVPARRRSSIGRRASISTRRRSVDKARVIVSKEQLKMRVASFSFVLVGDVQEMPLVHLRTETFEAIANDWSGDMRVRTAIDLNIKYFNPTNSYFEPLLEPWGFKFAMSRITTGPSNSLMDIRFSAARRAEINLTSAFIALAITTMTVWSKEGEDVRAGRRGTDAPFLIRNKTGRSILVWSDKDGGKASTSRSSKGIKRLADGDEIPWRFEDKRRARDRLSDGRRNQLGVELPDTRWQIIHNISVDRQGEEVLPLLPALDGVRHQMLCEIHLEQNIKVITFRSTFNVENETSIPMELIIVDTHGKAAHAAVKIDPGKSWPLPLREAYENRFRIRPLRGFGFDFSWSMALHWRQLVSKPIRPITCKHQSSREHPFIYQAQANYNKNDARTAKYPRLSLRIRAPVEIENLLPYDFKFRLHDKDSELSSSNFLVKGGISPIHTVELSHLVLLSIEPLETGLHRSDYAIINTDDPELPIEDHFHCSDDAQNRLMLKLHYYTYPDSGGAFKVQVYSPYVVLNKTGMPFDLSINRSWSGARTPVALRGLFDNDYKNPEPTPFMFGYPNEDRRNRLHLSVDGSKDSKAMSFEPVSASFESVMSSHDNSEDYHIGVSYTEGLGKYKLTKVITFAPRFMVKNMSEYPLHIRQHGTEKSFKIAPGSLQSYIKLQSRAASQLSMAIDQNSLKWSAPFNLSDIGRTHLLLKRTSTTRGERSYLMQVDAHLEGATIFLYISRDKGPWPIKVRNDTEVPFSFQQTSEDYKEARYAEVKLPPGETVDYTWDSPTEERKRLRLIADGIPLPKTIDIMAIGVLPPAKIPKTKTRRSVTFSLDIQADGASQLLVISPYNEETSVFKPTRRNTGGIGRTDSTDSLPTIAFDAVKEAESPTMKVEVDFEGIGISVITRDPKELVYITFKGLKLAYTDFKSAYGADVECTWIQIDNQLFGGNFPIILYPARIQGKDLEAHPTLQATVSILKDQSHGVMFIKYASILLQSIAIEVDEDFLYALLDFVKFKDASWTDETPDVLIEHPKDVPEPTMTNAQADIFFEILDLQPMALELSFVRTDRINTVDDKPSSRNPLAYGLNALLMALGNVTNAPIQFRSLSIENVRLSIPSLEERIILHYKEQALAQVYRVLGSADFLGNPVGLFNNISSGVGDIFYEPYQGIVMNGNRDIGLGIARGASSFAKKTIFGVTDSMTKFTSSIGKGLSAATLDAEYQSKRRMTQRRNRPRHALYGVAVGATAFADSVTSAFEGVASKPMEGAEKGGASGFVTGVGKGVVGLFTKPAVGVMDFLSSATEGVRNTTTVFDNDNLDKMRLPRFIPADGVLRNYDRRNALGQDMLKSLVEQEKNITFVAHVDANDGYIGILSSDKIYLVQHRKSKVVWQQALTDLGSISLENNGIALVNKDGRPGPFLPLSDKASREWFFGKMGEVVHEYNRIHDTRGEFS